MFMPFRHELPASTRISWPSGRTARSQISGFSLSSPVRVLMRFSSFGVRRCGRTGKAKGGGPPPEPGGDSVVGVVGMGEERVTLSESCWRWCDTPRAASPSRVMEARGVSRRGSVSTRRIRPCTCWPRSESASCMTSQSDPTSTRLRVRSRALHSAVSSSSRSLHAHGHVPLVTHVHRHMICSTSNTHTHN